MQGYSNAGEIKVTTTMDFEGYKVKQYLGLVRGLIVRSPTITQGLMGGLKMLVGGNIAPLAEMCETARQHAFDKMIEHARTMGANAVIGVRYDASELGGDSSATEVLCYGTAVVITSTY